MLNYIRAIYSKYVPVAREDFSFVADNSVSQKLLILHNKQRDEKHPLKLCEDLNNSAQKHAEWMAKNQLLSHDESWKGPTLEERVMYAGYNWSCVGENIAQGTLDVESTMRLWMASYWHRVNILDYGYKDVGFGISHSPDKTVYWCVNFGDKYS